MLKVNLVKPLFYATDNNAMEIMNVLLDKGARIGAKHNYGVTLLHNAVKHKQEEVANLLISYEADINARDETGKTPLHIAAQMGSRKILKLLLENGAKADFRDNDGRTALHIAAENDNEKVVMLLLENGAKADIKDEDGRTALHSTCSIARIEALTVLLEFGSDINITCFYGRTPLDEALRTFFFELDEFGECNRVAAEYLVCHIAKRKVANLYVSEKNLLIVNKIRNCIGFYDDDGSDFQDQCLRELERMKNEKICDCNVSFYDILTKGANSLAVYMRNENVVKALKSTNYVIEFPLYATLIKSHFRKGMQRKKLLELGNGSLHYLFNSLTGLLYDSTEIIFSYLSNEDLENLISVFKTH